MFSKEVLRKEFWSKLVNQKKEIAKATLGIHRDLVVACKAKQINMSSTFNHSYKL